MLQNGQKVLARAPSTRDPKRASAAPITCFSMPVQPIKVVGLVPIIRLLSLGSEHEAARADNASRRRGGHLAAHRTRTVAAESANHRVSRLRHVFSLEPLGRGVCSKT